MWAETWEWSVEGEREPLLTGEILLIKKNLLSKCFAGVLAVWHGYWVDGCVD